MSRWLPSDALLDEAGAPVTVEGRPDFGNHMFGVTMAKTFPPFLFSVSRNAMLVHMVVGVELRWYAPCYHHLIRLRTPRMIARLACGEFRFLAAARTRTCLVPSPDAVPCGRCNGELPPFGKRGWARAQGMTRAQAHVRLGCVVEGY